MSDAKDLAKPDRVRRMDVAPGSGTMAPPRAGQPTSKRRLLLIEFNELCPSLLDKWMRAGDLPNFKKFYDDSEVYVTESDEQHAPYLEPWIQWYSLHTGLSYRQHQVFNLTDGPHAGHEDMWDVLRGNGLRVANCSSMNCKGFADPNAFFLPDPWCTSERPSPEALGIFHKVVSDRVQEYSNKGTRLTAGDYVRFLWFLLSHGLHPTTIASLVGQLVSETMSSGKTSWRRAAALDKLQFDVFRHYDKRLKFNFATFFSNSTAHYQHAYWRFMEPSLFAAPNSPEEAERYRDVVKFGYQEMDKLLGRFFEFEAEDTTLVFSTGLSQQPYLKYEAVGGQHFYRPRNVESLLAKLDIAYERIFPVMTHQYIAHFADTNTKENARRMFESILVNNDQVFGTRDGVGDSLYFGNQITGSVPDGAVVQIPAGGNAAREVPFYEIFYQINEAKSGFHHPDGALWIKSGNHRVHAEKVSILDVFPTVMDFFGVVPTSTEAAIRSGRSLWRAAHA